MNIVLDDAVEEKTGGEKVGLGMVVCIRRYQLHFTRGLLVNCIFLDSSQVIRGNSVVMLEVGYSLICDIYRVLRANHQLYRPLNESATNDIETRRKGIIRNAAIYPTNLSSLYLTRIFLTCFLWELILFVYGMG